MVTKLKEVDAVVIGMGWTGSILSRELTKAGLNVVGLERGAMRTPREDFAIPNIRDELKYQHRHELFQDTAAETVTLRHNMSETALPIRRLGSFLPGTLPFAGCSGCRDLARDELEQARAEPRNARSREQGSISAKA